MKINKRGSSNKILTIWDFILFGIIAIGFVSAVFAVNSKEVDFRQTEAEILADKVMGCVIMNGEIITEKFDKIKNNVFDFKEDCKIRVLENLFAEVVIKKDDESEKFSYSDGNVFIKDLCGSDVKGAPKCSIKVIQVKYNEMNYFVEVLGGSNHNK